MVEIKGRLGARSPQEDSNLFGQTRFELRFASGDKLPLLLAWKARNRGKIAAAARSRSGLSTATILISSEALSMHDSL